MNNNFSEDSKTVQSDYATSEVLEITMGDIENYVNSNLVQASVGRKCVDGRYSHDADCGRIARPGGDMGYVMALIKLSNDYGLCMSPTECFEAVHSATIDDIFRAHTDQQSADLCGSSQSKSCVIGCGHLAKAMALENAGLYGVRNDQIEEIVELLFQREKIEIACLSGEHKERGVLIINSFNKSVLPNDLEKQFFVYDQLRDEEYMKSLCENIAKPGVTFERMRDASNYQLGATLSLLARGLPIYQVDLTGDSNKVSAVGYVK